VDTIFKPGDVVQLKSGGPILTVNNVEPTKDPNNPNVFCGWFAGKKLERGTFAAVMLKHAGV